MNFLRMSVWSVGAVLAAFVTYASVIIASQVRAPSPPIAPYLWHTATSEANFAYAAFALRKSKDPEASVRPAELQLARHAYQIEPLSTAALGLTIASLTDAKVAATRGKLVDLAGKLSRRSPVITAFSIEEAARANDQKRFFAWMSRAILTDSTLRTSYIGAMSLATASDGAVEALLPVLGPNPPWAKYYWAAVASKPASLANATTLRIAVARPPWRQSKITETDYSLARSLVKAGQFDDARRLAREFEKAASENALTNNLLANGNFAREPQLPPMDWTLATSGHLGASVDARSKRLAISAIAGAFGRAAWQLVELAPGEYRVAWTLEADKIVGDRALSVNLTCAEKRVQAATIQPIVLAVGTHVQNLVVPGETCRWYWFSINTRVPDDSTGLDAFLRQISLTRVD